MGVGLLRAGGVVVTWDLVLEGYSIAQLSIYSFFCVRPLSLLFVFLVSPIQLTLERHITMSFCMPVMHLHLFCSK